MNMLKYILLMCKNFILDLFFPTYCIKCDKKGDELCESCSLDFKYPDQENMDDIFACFEYQDPTIKRLLHGLKYYKKQNIGKIFGKYIYDRHIEEISELRTFSAGNPIILIPVPLTKKRYKERGYNQAEIIARGIIESDKDNIFALENKIITKVKDTLPQAKIKNRNTRLKNIVGCFILNKNKNIKGRTVIVIDDITTTGGTIREIMKILKKAGCKKVVGFAVAH